MLLLTNDPGTIAGFYVLRDHMPADQLRGQNKHAPLCFGCDSLFPVTW